MSSRGPQSSQMGLFSTQISEQIVRLRALGQGGDLASDNGTVEIRRAVMATRLLSGSARILDLSLLPDFLDELLRWLQSLEQHPGGMTTTQSLILESVIELEESLMIALDGDDLDSGSALKPFREQIEDLRTLVRRNAREAGLVPGPDFGVDPREPEDGDRPEDADDTEEVPEVSDTEEIPVARGTEEPSEVPSEVREIEEPRDAHGERDPPEVHRAEDELGEVVGSEEELEDLLTLAAEELQRLVGAGFEDARELAGVWTHLEDRVSRVRDLLDDLARRGREAVAVVALDREDETRGPALDHPEEDEVLGPALARLRSGLSRSRATLLFRGYGGAAAVHPEMRALTRRLLELLVDDVAVAIVYGGESDNELHSYHVSVELRADEGALHVVLSDDAPRSDRGAMFGETDHLALLSGLRRARNLLAQNQGLIRVEPEASPEQRYVLTLPLDPDRPRFTVFRIAGIEVALPSTLVEGVIPGADVSYQSDLNGAFFELSGHVVPMVDLSYYVAGLSAPEGVPAHLAVCGSVEKRLALACDGTIELHEDPTLTDPPEEWWPVAFGAFDVDGRSVPVLDVARLLRLRFRAYEESDVPGAMADPGVDVYEPVGGGARRQTPETAPAQSGSGADEPGRAAPESRSSRRVLLVNQSEFRRKDLTRTLQGMGFTVTVATDLHAASTVLDFQEIDLLVTDLRLGQERGASLSALRAGRPELRVVLTSSVAGQYADELADKTGADRVWLDPYRKSDLQVLLGELLR